MSSRTGRAYETPMDRRSRSSSSHLPPQPYHAISEVYTKEITHHPIGPASEYPPEIIDILREEPRAPHADPPTPPLIRSRENTWTPENFPIVRVPSAQFTDIMTELYDYHEVEEKYTRRSVTPDLESLRRQSDITEHKGTLGPKRPTQNPPPLPTYQVIPPTPEKHTPRHPLGIPLTSSEPLQKKPLPMYEEYVQMQKDENRNIPIPRARSRSKSPLTSSESESNNQINNNHQFRHIDSSSSESVTEPEATIQQEVVPDGKRFVYSHDVYVDSTTGRPFTPGRGEIQEKKNCDKLKINVYFKPPQPPVEAVYRLDEIEIEKQEDILVSKLRPSRSVTILSQGVPSNTSVHHHTEIPPPSEMEHRRIPTRTSVLRKEHEIVTVPLNRSQGIRQSRISEQSTRSKTFTERSHPTQVGHHSDKQSINMDEIFPKLPHPQTVTNVHYPPSRTSTISRVHVPEHRRSIDKGDYHHQQQRVPSVTSQQRIPVSVQGAHDIPLTRGTSKTPSVQDYRVKRPSDRSPSFVSHAPSHKTERTPSEVRIPVTVTSSQGAPAPQRPLTKRESPEELDYGKNGQSRFPGDQGDRVKDLPYTRGLSQTPSDKDRQVYDHRVYTPTVVTPPSTIHIPYNNPEKERAHQVKSIPSARSSYRSETNKSLAPSEKSHQKYGNAPSHAETPELAFTRGISKTPSDKDYGVEKSPSSHVHIPYNNPEKERAYQQSQSSPKRVPSGRAQSPPKTRVRSPSAKARPTSQGPFEEIVHIKERYERDETIRRFFPTTTTV